MSPHSVLHMPSGRGWEKSSIVAFQQSGRFSRGLQARIWVMVVLFCVSLFAAGFPTLSKRVRRLRVPRILFFIGKHFGTGVILSTAFVHLLQEAFENLGHPDVRKRWKVGNFTGLIVLGSLLAIFLIEYISTSFVDRLQSYSSPTPSPPPSPTPSPLRSPSPSPHAEFRIPRTAEAAELLDTEQTPLISNTTAEYGSTVPPLQTLPSPQHPRSQHISESSRQYPPTREREQLPRRALSDDPFFSGGHHRHELKSEHVQHSGRVPKVRESYRKISDIVRPDSEEDLVGVRKPDQNQTHRVEHTRKHEPERDRAYGDGDTQRERERQKQGERERRKQGERHEHRPRSHGDHDHHRAHDISHGHDHAHVHLAFEEWDPEAAAAEGREEGGVVEETAEVKIGHRRQVVGILMLQVGIMIHSLVIGLTLAITTGSEFTSLVAAIIFHQLFEGLSLGIRIANLPTSPRNAGWARRLFKFLLAFMFAITCPVGIAIGLGTFYGGHGDGAQMRLIQGIMSAISSGMLIYAACIEMLAGDFIMDPLLWRSSIKRQMCAVASLFAGVVAMAIIGIWD